MTTECPTQARKSPEWLKTSVMYQIFLRAFTPEGTLAAATKRLPEVAALGADIVYLCPICLQDDDPRREFWSERQRKFDSPFNPYRIKDFYTIDPEYGNDGDLLAFVAEAHRLGLRVLLDIVFFHCGPTAVFIEAHPDFIKRGPDGKPTNGSWCFPALNFDNPELREYLWRNMEMWIEKFAVDGYRCDVSDAVPLDFWDTARARLEKLNPDVITLAEGQRKEDQRYAFEMNYNFSMAFATHAVFTQGNPASSLRRLWEKQHAEYPEGTRFIRYIDNHDIAHDFSWGLTRAAGQSDESWENKCRFHGLPLSGVEPDSRPDRIWGYDAVNALLALCFALDGVPFLYNGQEVADFARHSIYGRMPVAWDNADTPRGKARQTFCRKLCELRHREKALADAPLTWLENGAPDHILSFQRRIGEECVLVLISLAKTPVVTAVADLAGSFTSLLSEGVALEGNKASFKPYGFFIGRK